MKADILSFNLSLCVPLKLFLDNEKNEEKPEKRLVISSLTALIGSEEYEHCVDIINALFAPGNELEGMVSIISRLSWVLVKIITEHINSKIVQILGYSLSKFILQFS